jgi:hypothetical protein
MLLSAFRAYGRFIILFVIRYVFVPSSAALLYSVFLRCLPVNGFTDTANYLTISVSEVYKVLHLYFINVLC